MNDFATQCDVERLERTVHRMFARISVLEARVNELERELTLARGIPSGFDRLRLVEAVARPA